MSTYKLYYFNDGGRAEVARLVFAAAGQKYEDIHSEFSEWPPYLNDMPLRQKPVLEVDAGKDDSEEAKVDAVTNKINDIIIKMASIRLFSEEAKKQELIKKFVTEELSTYLQNIEALYKLYRDGGPYLVGNHLTWMDLFLYNAIEYYLTIDGNILDNHSWLKENRAAVEKQPRIAEYLKNRPKPSFQK